ncbi:hypothetical protein OPV22_026169 [Ensete ventricosum]|uniref:Uncharacterized protein n=1 Tax=Ensete ventricosum TaxID=4639 RepID=A0AAV8P886_ENSVE|nr:hypothetical protein OPV22_026169 [Ensete ventricosum]
MVVDGNNVADLSKESLLSHSNACYHINFTFSNFDRNRTWRRGYTLRKGPKYVLKRKKAATALTREHLQRGD